MKKLIPIFLFFVLVLLNSCKNTDNPTSPNNTSTSKASDGSNIMPLNKGAWFKFNRDYTSTSGVSITKVLGDTILNGKTYAIIGVENSLVKSFMREEKGALYSLSIDTIAKVITENKIADFTLQNINDKWTFDSNLYNNPNRLKFYYLGNEFKYNFKGNEYNAYKFRCDIYVFYGGTEILGVTQYNWYIKGIGLVYSNTVDYGTDELIDYGTN